MFTLQFRGQIFTMDLAPGGHDGEPARGIFQLAHIAAPLQRFQFGHRIRQQGLGFHSQLRRCTLEEVVHQQGDVLATFAQCRQVHTDHIETMEQVLTETPFAHQLLEILMRGRDDTYIRLDRLMTTDAVELTIGEDPQQPGLQLGRHVADLVEKKCAAVGLFETPGPTRLRAGESPFLMPEQLGLQKIMRDGGHVQRDERTVGPRAVLVQGIGHQLLAGARLAIDQHRDVGAGQAPDRPKHLLHRRRRTDNLGCRATTRVLHWPVPPVEVCRRAAPVRRPP